MTLQQFAASAVLYRRETGGKLAFLGSCFAFRKRHVFLSAAHCVGRLDAAELAIGSAFTSILQATKLTRHPFADLVAIEVDPSGLTAVAPWHTLALNTPYGAEVGAIGFPEDSSPNGGSEPTARYFRGSIQRFLNYKSHLGFEYHAAELSFGAPAGLSGGAVIRADTGWHLVGVVAENFESSTYLRSIEEIQQDGSSYKEKIHAVINYAICVWLPAPNIHPWLDQVAGLEF